MQSSISVWILKQNCNCDLDPFGASSVLSAIETNDGIHTLSFVFTDHLQGTEAFLGHRIVFIPAVSNEWVSEVVNVGREYASAQWVSPGALTFSLVFSVGGSGVGWHAAYFSQIETHRSSTELGLVSETVVLLTRFQRISQIRLNL